MALELTIKSLSQRFQIWLIGTMVPLAFALAVLWLWNDAILDPAVQLCWAAAAVLICLLAWLVVRHAFDANGGFRGWRQLLTWPR